MAKRNFYYKSCVSWETCYPETRQTLHFKRVCARQVKRRFWNCNHYSVQRQSNFHFYPLSTQIRYWDSTTWNEWVRCRIAFFIISFAHPEPNNVSQCGNSFGGDLFFTVFPHRVCNWVNIKNLQNKNKLLFIITLFQQQKNWFSLDARLHWHSSFIFGTVAECA